MAVCDVLPRADGSLLVVDNLNDRPHRPQGAESIFRYDDQGRRDPSYGPAAVPLRLHHDAMLLAAPGGGAVALDLTAPSSYETSLPERFEALAVTAGGEPLAAWGGRAGELGHPAFGGGSIATGGRPRVPPLSTDEFLANTVASAVRPDGTLVLAGLVTVSGGQVHGRGGQHVDRFGVAAFTPSLRPDSSFGKTPPFAIGASLPAQTCTQGASAQPCVALSLTSSQPGVVRVVAATATGEVVARGAAAMLVSATQTIQVPLTPAGRRLLRGGAQRGVTVSLVARDLAGDLARATTRGVVA